MKSEKEILEALKKSVVDADEKLLMQTIDAAEHAEAPVTESWAEEIGADAVKKENAQIVKEGLKYESKAYGDAQRRTRLHPFSNT